MSISKDPLSTPVDLSPFLVDNQNLTVNGDTLRIARGNSVLTDNSITNEIQTIRRSNDTIYLSKGGGFLKLPADQVDDADHDPANELQTLSYNAYNLTINSGNTINIRPDVIAFRVTKGSGSTIINPGDSTKLIFPTEILDKGDCFNNDKFAVPAGGAGLYFFEIIYKYDGNQSLRIFLNNIKKEDIYPAPWGPMNGTYIYSFLLDLTDGDYIHISSNFSNNGLTQAGILMGYRIH